METVIVVGEPEITNQKISRRSGSFDIDGNPNMEYIREMIVKGL